VAAVATLFAVRIVAAMAALASVALLVGAAPAGRPSDTLLRPGVGVGTIRLGMPLSEVRSVLGRPSAVVRRKPYGFGSEYVEYAWGIERAWHVGVLRRRTSRVVFLVTSRPARTASGAGVGSTYQVLQRKLGARCYRQPVSPTLPGAAEMHRDFVGCRLGRLGKPVTGFELLTECTIPADRYSRECPDRTRRYVASEVWMADRLGQDILDIRDIR
jgi:hypothetical protein